MSAPTKAPPTEYHFIDVLPGKPYVPAPRSPHRNLPKNAFLDDFAEALRQHTMTWAAWPRTLTVGGANSALSRVRDGFYRALRPGGGFEAVVREGTLYVRFNPAKVSDDRTAAFREGYEAGYRRGLESAGLVIERGFQHARAELRRIKGVEDVLTPPGVLRGEKSPQAKLAEFEVQEAREAYATKGITLKQLAEEYGVSIATIHNAISGMTWGHVGSGDLPHFGQGKGRAGDAHGSSTGGEPTAADGPGPDAP